MRSVAEMPDSAATQEDAVQTSVRSRHVSARETNIWTTLVTKILHGSSIDLSLCGIIAIDIRMLRNFNILWQVSHV